jgi:NDP-sugar pyrophosphorylase family protein
LDSSPARISGVVLAGGYQWADSALGEVPRPLLPVAQRPLITYGLRWLSEAGIQRVTVCSNSGSAALRATLSQPGLGLDELDLDYYEDWTPRGPAGCVHDAALDHDTDDIVVTDGGSVPGFDLGALIAEHRSSRAAVTIAVQRGISAMGRPSLPTPTGVYVLARRVLASVPRSGFQDMKENLIPRLYRAGERVVSHVIRGECPRVLDADTYLAVNHWAVEHLVEQPVTPIDYTSFGDTLSHTSARIALDARLVGPVLVGPGARIMAGAVIVGPATLGSGCIVGEGALIARSVLGERSTVGAGARVDRSVLADEALVDDGDTLYGEVRVSSRAAGGASSVPWLRPSEAPASGHTRPALP